MKVTKSMLHDENKAMDEKIIRLKREIKRGDKKYRELHKILETTGAECHKLTTQRDAIMKDYEELRRKALNDHLMVETLRKEIESIRTSKDELEKRLVSTMSDNLRLFKMLEAVILKKERND